MEEALVEAYVPYEGWVTVRKFADLRLARRMAHLLRVIPCSAYRRMHAKYGSDYYSPTHAGAIRVVVVFEED